MKRNKLISASDQGVVVTEIEFALLPERNFFKKSIKYTKQQFVEN